MPLLLESPPRSIRCTYPLTPWAPWVYCFVRAAFHIPFYLSIKAQIVNADLAADGRFILACTHLGNLEPPILGVILRRRIDWMARAEFFRRRWAAAFLRSIDAFPVHRQGVPVRALRTAIHRAAAGRTLGVFPEGGVAAGAESVCRGGPIKHGTAFIAIAAQVPVLPVAVLNIQSLCQVGPWMPGRRGRLWIMFGPPILPPPFTPGRAAAAQRRAHRAAMTAQLHQSFMDLYAELHRRYDIPPDAPSEAPLRGSP